MKIALYGFGSFNMSLGLYLDRKFSVRKDVEMQFWDIDSYIFEYFGKNHAHPYHFPNIRFSSKVSGTRSKEELLKDADYVIVGIVSQAIRENAREFHKFMTRPTTVILVSKGLEQDTMKRSSQVISEELKKSRFDHKIAVFSGGTTAADIVGAVPLIAEVASDDHKTAECVAELFHGMNLRIYTNDDMCSVEIAAALKNVVSIGAGICEGLGFETGTVSSFVTRATYDIYKVAKVLGAHDKTFLPGSASVWGDIMLSSFGKTRNREYGQRLCEQGMTPEKLLDLMKSEHKSIEGYFTVKAAYDLAKKHGVTAPCIEQIYRILYEKTSPKNALKSLMGRKRIALQPKDS